MGERGALPLVPLQTCVVEEQVVHAGECID